MKTRSHRSRPDPKRSLVGFVVGEVHYAIPVEAVSQVVNPMSTTPLPHMPPSIVGVAEHRGSLIPVVDLRIHFGTTANTTRKTKWILVSFAGERMGIVVDEVTGVLGAMAEDVRPAPSFGAGDGRGSLAGVASLEGKLIFVVEESGLLNMAQPAIATNLPEASNPSGRGAD